MAFKYGTSLLLKATDVYKVLRVAKTTSKDNKEAPPNTVLGLSCPNDVGERTLEFLHLYNLREGEEVILQETDYPFFEGSPSVLVYKCVCGLHPCTQTAPMALVDYENGPTVHSTQMRGVTVASLPVVFKLLTH